LPKSPSGDTAHGECAVPVHDDKQMKLVPLVPGHRPVSVTRGRQDHVSNTSSLDWMVVKSEWVKKGEVIATADSFTDRLPMPR